MKKKMMTSLFSGTLAVMLILVLNGCGRKHIVSSPPGQQPTAPVVTTPAQKTEAVQKKPELIEETYTVDAPKEAAPVATIREGELEEEPMTAPSTTGQTAAPEAGQDKKTESEAQSAPQGKIYYVQIGAFSDLENANRALARLLSDGYKGSRLSRTEDGLFRIQAGTFPDEASAREALSKLLADYPKGFVLSNSMKE